MVGGLQDFSVSPSPLLGFLGLGFKGILDLRVLGLGLDNKRISTYIYKEKKMNVCSGIRESLPQTDFLSQS